MARQAKEIKQDLSLFDFMQKFSSEDKAREYIEQVMWGDNRHCPRCACVETKKSSHRSMPYWCKACRKHFSVRTGTLMENSRLPYRKWLMDIYLIGDSNGISSHELAKRIGITQKNAWHLLHRIREAWKADMYALIGMSVEVDETFLLDPNTVPLSEFLKSNNKL